MNTDFVNRYNNGERYFLNMSLDDSDCLENLDLGNATFENCDIATSLNEANLTNAKFISCNLNTSNFSKCNLDNTVFTNCSLESTLFTGVDFSRVQFIGCHCYGQDVELDVTTQSLMPIMHPNVKVLYEYVPELIDAMDHTDDWSEYLTYGNLSRLLYNDVNLHETIMPFTQKCFGLFNLLGDKNDSETDSLLVTGVYEELYSNKKCNEAAMKLLHGRNKELYLQGMNSGFIQVDI